MNPILESLKDGPKLYSELRGQTDAALFDIQLGKLLRSRAIVRVYDYSGETAKFGLPPPPPTDDDPCLKIIQSKTLLTLKKKKNQYCFDKEGRKKCSACGKRKGRSRFMYAGKTWGKCFDCRETP